MTLRASPSLRQFFRAQAIKWSSAGLLLTVGFTVPCVLYSAKTASERQVLLVAKSAARAFRPLILQGAIRDAEFQMKASLELKPGESAVVLDPSFQPIYPLDETGRGRCETVGNYCWDFSSRQLSVLYPIYFDEERKTDLYGYLAVTINATMDYSTLLALVFLLLAAFIGQAFGLSSALSQSARLLASRLNTWADYLKKSPTASPAPLPVVPFTELSGMQEAVDTLHVEIERLREQTVKEATVTAQFALLREIGHDLRTPHSQLAKYFALHLDTVQSTGRINADEVSRVERTLKRMGELIRQVRIFQDKPAEAGGVSESCSLVPEIRTILADLRSDPEVIEKNISLELQTGTSDCIAQISKVGFYRIVENLVRNAVQAVQPDTGAITIGIASVQGYSCLSVEDNGTGIPPEAQARIFDFEFTTKTARGTGLGLGIVRRICDQFGAEIDFSTKVGTGTKFTIRFESAARATGPNPPQGVVHAQI